MLFVLSFTTPAFDSDIAPSFGTLLATVNVVLNMQGEVRDYGSLTIPKMHANL